MGDEGSSGMLKILLGATGLIVILQVLGIGALASFASFFTSDLLLITIGIFLLIWFLRRK